MYEAELKELGLTDNEIKVYLVLLEHGILNPTSLAQKTGLHRSYIYDTIERLLEKGIVNTVLRNNKRHYQPVDPKILKETFEMKLRQLDTVLPKLQALFTATKEETRVELHKGKRVYKTLIKDIVADIKKNDIIYILGADETMIENVEPIYIKQYFNIIKQKNVKEKIIIAKGNKKLKEKNLEYREVEPKYLDETTIVIFHSKVYIFIWGTPHHLIIIESGKFSNTYRKQFELLWNMHSEHMAELL